MDAINNNLALKNRIEALLFTREEALNIATLAQVLNIGISEIIVALEELKQSYENSAMELIEVASGWRFQLRDDYNNEINNLSKIQAPRYSRAFWETLAFIAYNQPVTRSDIDRARGVQTSSNIYHLLFNLEWIEVIGHKKALGSPALLAVTKRFLDHFSLKNISELPNLDELDDKLEIIENQTE